MTLTSKIVMYILFLSYSFISSAETLVVVNKGDGTVSFISTDSGKISESPVGYLPHEVAVTETHAFVSNYGHQHVRSTSLKNKPGNTISMINLSDTSLVEEIALGEGPCAPHGIEGSPDGRHVFVTCEGRQEIAVISKEKKRVINLLRTNQPGSHMLTVSPDQKLFVTNFWIGTISVIDIKSGNLIKQIYAGRSVEGLGLSPDGKFLYATVVEANELLKISVDTLDVKIRAQLQEGTSPIRVQVSNDNSKLVVNHVGRNSTGIYDGRTLELLKEIPVGKQPIGLALSANSNKAYVANMKEGSISVIDLDSEAMIKTLTLGLSLPDGLSVVP